MPDTETLLLTFGYGAIFFLMIANGLLSIPSSQVLYIIVGYFIGIGTLSFFPASLLGALGNTIGCVLLYEGVRRFGAQFIEKLRIFPRLNLSKLETAFRARGLWFLFVGKLLPAIKVFVPIPAGLAKVNRAAFALLMFTASLIWACGFIAIGYVFGKSADVWKSYGTILLVVAIGVVIVFSRFLEKTGALARDDENEENNIPR